MFDSMVYEETDRIYKKKKKLLEVISEFSMVSRYQVSIQKSTVCVYS